MKTFKLLLCLFFGIQTFSCFGESTYYILHMNEESYQFFKELEKRYLQSGDAKISLWHIEESKRMYGSNMGYFAGDFFDLINRYLQHNDRCYEDCYEVAFWLVFLCENNIPMGENTTQEISHFLILFEQELRHLCSGRANLQSPDIEEAIKGITFQPIQSQPSKGPAKQISKRKQCLLL
ncbi:MAG: hypothetical protein LBH52_01300 [Puniceicoccales bacterium]|jgi:hypothetical protein|nr:hypothetical protein [Puniceicoccales bacterium]